MDFPAYDCKENEHQELFFVGVDMAQPIKIHIPSPIGRLPYHVFVRLPSEFEKRIDSVVTKIDVGGLRDENHELPTEEQLLGATMLPSKAEGYSWHLLCTADVSRGNGTLQFLNVPPGIGNVDLLLCTWPRFVASGQADDWLECQSDPLWAPSGVPLGGIGGGRVDICRDGRFRNFSMNNNQDAPLEDPMGLEGAFLAVSGATLTSRPVVDGGAAVPSLQFDARFPQAILIAENAVEGIDVEVTFSGTLTPHDIKISSIPGFLMRWKITNRSHNSQSVAASFEWPNLVGVGGGVSKVESKIGEGDGAYRHWSQQATVSAKTISDDVMGVLQFSAKAGDDFAASLGEHVVAVAGGIVIKDELGKGPGKSGTVIRNIEIEPRTTVEFDMAMVAAMPHWVDSHHVDRGAHWQNFFAGGIEMAEHLLHNADAILSGTAALANHLDDGTIPDWLARRLSNCCYPLVTNSVFYKDGRFSINEGPTEMVGCYGTIDQRLAAHPATQLLFPSLNDQELSEFAGIQAANGGISHDLGHGHLERGATDTHWPDLTCSFVIQTARHSWSTGDKAFEAAMYPCAVRALRRHAEWATDGRGVAQLGHGLGTSYDSYRYFATTGYMATLWIAALNIGEEWAKRRGDDELIPNLIAWREAAVKRLDADIWNGKYYDAYGNGADISRKTCHAGQIAGQWFSTMLTGRDVLTTGHLDSVVDSLLILNGSDRYAVPPDEVAPDGSVGSDFCWLPYIEGFMLTAIATRGDERLWPIWERMIAATYADGATPCDTRLMYIPETGAQTWGTYYMTAPASWLVYDAWTGFFHDANLQLVRFRELAPGRYPIVSPLFWATLEAAHDGRYTLRIKRTFEFASLPLVAIEMHGNQGSARVELPRRTTIAEGEIIEWAHPSGSYPASYLGTPPATGRG